MTAVTQEAVIVAMAGRLSLRGYLAHLWCLNGSKKSGLYVCRLQTKIYNVHIHNIYKSGHSHGLEIVCPQAAAQQVDYLKVESIKLILYVFMA